MLSTDGRLEKQLFGGMAPLWGVVNLDAWICLARRSLIQISGTPGLLTQTSTGSVTFSTSLGGIIGFAHFLDPCGTSSVSVCMAESILRGNISGSTGGLSVYVGFLEYGGS